MPQNRNSNSSQELAHARQNLASAEPIAKEMPKGTAKKVANKKMKATKQETLPLLKPVNAEGRAVKVSAKYELQAAKTEEDKSWMPAVTDPYI